VDFDDLGVVVLVILDLGKNNGFPRRIFLHLWVVEWGDSDDLWVVEMGNSFTAPAVRRTRCAPWVRGFFLKKLGMGFGHG
jgi:hypothetical protein